MINLVGVFRGTDDQKCFQRVLLGLVVFGSKKLFLGILTKNKIFYQHSFLEFYADSAGDRRKKNSVYRPGGREGKIRSKNFSTGGRTDQIWKKKFYHIVFSGVATAEQVRRLHDLKISHIQIINT
jgi:hypothetical protein